MRLLIQTGLIALMLAATAAGAEELSPVGLWKNIDDVTGKPKALIRISEVNGELQGRIEKLLRTDLPDANPRCTAGQGDRKNQPIVGLVFLSGLKKSGEHEYSGGEILDPDNGKTNRSKLNVLDGGKKLDVRGYIGMPMLGRSQVWLREQ
ncbi:MAG: DUF2147 domain-containing protein [Gammaproteobacteria bacterium]